MLLTLFILKLNTCLQQNKHTTSKQLYILFNFFVFQMCLFLFKENFVWIKLTSWCFTITYKFPLELITAKSNKVSVMWGTIILMLLHTFKMNTFWAAIILFGLLAKGEQMKNHAYRRQARQGFIDLTDLNPMCVVNCIQWDVCIFRNWPHQSQCQPYSAGCDCSRFS